MSMSSRDLGRKVVLAPLIVQPRREPVRDARGHRVVKRRGKPEGVAQGGQCSIRIAKEPLVGGELIARAGARIVAAVQQRLDA